MTWSNNPILKKNKGRFHKIDATFQEQLYCLLRSAPLIESGVSRAPQETCKLIIPKLLSGLFSLISLNIGELVPILMAKHTWAHIRILIFSEAGNANPACNWSFLAVQNMLFLFVSFVPTAQLKPPSVSDNLSVSLFRIMTLRCLWSHQLPSKDGEMQKKNYRTFLPRFRPVVPPSFVSDIVGNVAKIPIERQGVYK